MNDPQLGPPSGGPPPPFGPPSGFNYRPPPSKAKLSPVAIVAVFIGALMALALVVAVFVAVSQPAPPVAPCEPGKPCVPTRTLPPVAAASPVTAASAVPATTTQPGMPVPGQVFVPPASTPTSDAPVVIAGERYVDDTLGYAFEFDPHDMTLGDSANGSAVLNGVRLDSQVWVDATSADMSPAQMIDRELSDVDRFLIGRTNDTDGYDALLGPSIGYIRGQGGVWSGSLLGKDGTPVAPGGVTIVAATDGHLTVAVVVIVGTPDARLGDDTQQHYARQAADMILKTFDWGSGQ